MPRLHEHFAELIQGPTHRNGAFDCCVFYIPVGASLLLDTCDLESCFVVAEDPHAVPYFARSFGTAFVSHGSIEDAHFKVWSLSNAVADADLAIDRARRGFA